MQARVKEKGQITLPHAFRERAGIQIGDVIDFEMENDQPTMRIKRLIDRHLAESLRDLENGHIHGPFDNAEDLIESLNRTTGRKRKKKK